MVDINKSAPQTVFTFSFHEYDFPPRRAGSIELGRGRRTPGIRPSTMFICLYPGNIPQVNTASLHLYANVIKSFLRWCFALGDKGHMDLCRLLSGVFN